MTQTPEERARVLANRLDGAGAREWNALIAQAIRQAEDDVLERAAQMLGHRAMTFLPPDTQLLAKCAQAVRALKSKKD